MKTLAFIGLGRMGRLMAANLESAGFSVRSFDLNGTGNCRSAKQAAAGAQVLITMLPDGKAVRKAVLAASPSPGTVVVDMSSSDPTATRQLEKQLKKKGVSLVDAPVSGSVAGARDATLAIMAGGDGQILKAISPVLHALGKKTFHVGPVGSGHAMKALNNYIGASGTIAAFEALLVGKAFGLDPALMVEVFNASTGYNSTTRRKIPQQVLTNAFASGFSAALMTKDVGIAASLSKTVRVPSPYLRATSRLWRDALRRLRPGADHTEMYRYLEKLKLPSRGAASRRSRSRRKRRRST